MHAEGEQLAGEHPGDALGLPGAEGGVHGVGIADVVVQDDRQGDAPVAGGHELDGQLTGHRCRNPTVHRLLLTLPVVALNLPWGEGWKPAGAFGYFLCQNKRPAPYVVTGHLSGEEGSQVPDQEEPDGSVLDEVAERLGFRAFFAKHAWLDLTYRIAVGVLGASVVVIGFILIPLPGPGWLIVFAGLAHPGHRVRLGRAAAQLRPRQGARLDPVGHPAVAARAWADRADRAARHRGRGLGVRRRRRAAVLGARAVIPIG